MNRLEQRPVTTGPQGGVSPEPGVASVERRAFGLPGVPAVLLWLVLAGLAGWSAASGLTAESGT